MKILLLTMALLGVRAHASNVYNLTVNPSSGTIRMAGDFNLGVTTGIPNPTSPTISMIGSMGKITALSGNIPDNGAQVTNVLSIGFHNDGVTDNLAAWNTLASSIGGKSVTFPPGQYVFSSTPTISNQNSFLINMDPGAYVTPSYSGGWSLIMSTVTHSQVHWNMKSAADNGVEYTGSSYYNDLWPDIERNVVKSAAKPPLYSPVSIGVKYGFSGTGSLMYYNRIFNGLVVNVDIGVWYSSSPTNNANGNAIYGLMCDSYWRCIFADAEEESAYGITGADNNGLSGSPTSLVYLSSQCGHSEFHLYGEGDSNAQMVDMDQLAGANGIGSGNLIFEGNNFVTADNIYNSSNTIISASNGIVSSNGGAFAVNGTKVGINTGAAGPVVSSGLDVNGNIALHAVTQKYLFGTSATSTSNALYRDSITGSDVFDSPIGWEWGLAGVNVATMTSAGALSIGGGLTVAPTNNVSISGSGARYTFGVAADVNNFLGRDSVTGSDVLGSPIGWEFQENAGGVIVATMSPTGALAINADYTGTKLALSAQPGVSAYLTGNISAPTASEQHVFWGAEVYNTVGTSMHSTSVSSDTITVPVAGYYDVECQLNYDSQGVPVGRRTAEIIVNGTATQGVLADVAPGVATTLPTATARRIMKLNANDYLQCEYYHTAGVAETIDGGVETSFFIVQKLF